MLRALGDREEAASYRLTGMAHPALPDALAKTGEQLTLMRGFPNRELAGHGPFDVVISINTIERTPDPAQFLATLASLMAPDGQAIVVCPTTEFANDELLFFDHFWSISPAAMMSFAAGSGLQLVGHRGLAAPLAGFQLFWRSLRSASARTASGICRCVAGRNRLSQCLERTGRLARSAIGSGRPTGAGVRRGADGGVAACLRAANICDVEAILAGSPGGGMAARYRGPR